MKSNRRKRNEYEQYIATLNRRLDDLEAAKIGVFTPNIYLQVLTFLPIRDLRTCALTCKAFYRLCHNRSFFIKKLKRLEAWDTRLAREHYREDRLSSQFISTSNDSSLNSSSFQALTSSSDDVNVKTEQSNSTVKKDIQFPVHIDYYSEGGKQTVIEVFNHIHNRVELARQDFLYIYQVLFPLYDDIVHANNTLDPIALSAFSTPEEQAQVIQLLVRFGHCAPHGYPESIESQIAIHKIADLFVKACLVEFEVGCDTRNFKMIARFANVLQDFSGPDTYLDTYVKKESSYIRSIIPFDPYSCLSISEDTIVQLAPLKRFVEQLRQYTLSQSKIVEKYMPQPEFTMLLYSREVIGPYLRDYITALCEHLSDEDLLSYLKVISGAYALCKSFIDISDGFVVLDVAFQTQIDVYMSQELQLLNSKTQRIVNDWNVELEKKADATVSVYQKAMSQSMVKNTFLKAFKEIMLRPTSLFSLSNTNDAENEDTLYAGEHKNDMVSLELTDSASHAFAHHNSTASMDTNELKLQVALMKERLSGISSLFNLEVALSLIHACKNSLARANVFLGVSASQDDDVRKLCKSLFITLLKVLGTGHLKSGFDRAIKHLSSFDPRNEITETIEPVVKFLELISVGDMIQQMIDAFYEEEMRNICVKDDTFDPAVSEKKNFEHLIDEKAAEGLHKGINVLMEHVDYLLETLTPPDYFATEEIGIVEPSKACQYVVQFLEYHLKLIVGCADREILDVFYKEIGMRLYSSICTFIRSQKFTTAGGIRFLSDANRYYQFALSLKQRDIAPYFKALKEIANLFIVDGKNSKEIGAITTDSSRFSVFRPEEVYEFAHCRSDWFYVKHEVDKAIYGMDCTVM
ncbi:F-box protein Pof6 [Schizosaccharomyces japonicus yFS275]|uniref:F-box protein Pof6 n=1 Tax=Schizosaccharomyces japonicus (strain yFS275 / FY16936) TaxID=402676 RepID=B6K131_SCHJY|nr:F-box protein Pof6 [Schizosaccharomyces japonicus yFS275]EEB07652.1 F-box protein Pof6 [Schizosaccharomyces japonicus yFS275]